MPLAFPPAPPVIVSLLGGGPGTRDLQRVNLRTASYAVFSEWTVDAGESLSVSAGLRYTGRQFFDTVNTALVAQNEAVTFITAAVTLEDRQRGWQLTLSVDNLSDKRSASSSLNRTPP